VDPDLAVNVKNRMKEFMELINRTHQHGLKAIIDFVPNHVARSYHSDVKPSHVKDLGENDNTSVFFSPQNNFYYLTGTKFQVPAGYVSLGPHSFPTKDGQFHEIPAKATGNNCFNAQPGINDWFETVKINYGIDFKNGEKKFFTPTPSTWIKMKDILMFWADKGIDGFRCDMAEMVPEEFWSWVIPQIKKDHQDLKFIAEIYTPSAYHNYIDHAGFDYLYDKVQLYDTLRHIVQHGESAENITTIWRDLAGINNKMVRFLENHDEQRIASPFFAGDAFKALPAMTVTATLFKGPVMIYFGQEVGEPGTGASGYKGDDGRTTLYDYWGVPEHQKWMNNGLFDGQQLSNSQKDLRNFYKILLNISSSEDAMIHGNFFDLSAWNLIHNKEQFPSKDLYCFLRISDKQTLLILVNFNKDKPYEFNFIIPNVLEEKTLLHLPPGDRRQDMIKKEKVLLLEQKKEQLSAKGEIDVCESLIFDL
jgi:glycosidase